MNVPAAAQPAAPQTPVPPPPPPLVVGALERRLTRIRAGVACWRLLWGLEYLCAGGMTVLALVALTDQVTRIDQDTLCTLSMVMWACAAAVLIGVCGWVWRRTPGRGLLALQLEARERAYAGHLLTAVESMERPDEVPPALAEISAEHSWRLLRPMPFRSIAPPMRWRGAHGTLAFSIAILVLGLGLFGVGYWRSVLDVAFPGASAWSVATQLSWIEVRPGDAAIEEGESLAIEARCEGALAGGLAVQVREAPGRPTSVRPLQMNDAGAWLGHIDLLRKPCEYRVVAFGSASAARRGAQAAASRWFQVRLRPGQAVRGVAALIEPPAYTGLPAYWIKEAELLEAPDQSVVTLLVEAVPATGLAEGHAQVPGGASLPFDRLADHLGAAQFCLRFQPERSGVLRLTIASSRKARADLQALLPIRLIGDRTPVVAARIPDGAAPDAEGLPVDLRAQDDYGLASLRLAVRPFPEGAELTAEGKREWRFAVPVTHGTRNLDERWVIPNEGLDEWFATGFEYRLEAEDSAQPRAQQAQSSWLRYEPHKRSPSQAEPGGLFDPPKQRRPRQLARGNAFSHLPNPSPEELAHMKGLGDGVDAPKQLRRPQAERLGDGTPASGGGSNRASGGGKAGGEAGSAEKDRYDLPQGPPKEHGKEGPPPTGDRKDGADGTDGGDRGSEQGTDTSQGKGEPEGGEPRSGQYQPKKKDERPGRGEGQGTSEDGQQTADGGEEANPGGAVDSSQTQPGSGPGGRRERDGGPKTGREAGAGRGAMAPPDMTTLARMKGLTPEEAEAYARQHRIAALASGFGTRMGGRKPQAGEQGLRQEMGPLDVNDATPYGGKTDGGQAPPVSENAVRLTWGEIDPIYQSSVEGYFQRWEEWRGK